MTGSGTQGDPYIISDVDDLQAIENNLGSYYELGSDIDASATSGWNAVYQEYTSAGSSFSAIRGDLWIAQTFSPPVSHVITSVEIKARRQGFPGTITVSIKATDGNGQPTEADLASGTTDGDTFISDVGDPPGEWREISLGGGTSLTGGQKYAIVIRALTGDESNNLQWRLDSSSPTYTGGNREVSLNASTTWTTFSNHDLLFKVHGTGGAAGFDPIILFTGQLDGKEYTISDLFINRPSETYVGLIGYTNASIVLKNISMTGVNITGQTDVGALLGFDNGGGTPDIDNCNSAGSVSASSGGQVGGLIGRIDKGAIDDCWSSCTVVSTTGAQAGGLIGYCISTALTNCYATGSITGVGATAASIGGLLGDLWDAVITKCYARGDAVGQTWVGGFVGRIRQNPDISNCYARGDATADPADWYAGGFTSYNNSGTIDNCYATGSATGLSRVGGFCGEDFGTITNCFWDTEASGNATSDGGTGKTTAQMKTQSTFTDAGWNFTTIWFMDGVTNNTYPFLGQGVMFFPSDTVARVSGIRHIFTPSSFRMQVSLGDLGFDVDVVDAVLLLYVFPQSSVSVPQC